jgi:hypothetical protein
MLEACGAPQSEGDVPEAATLWLRGQAAALLAVDRRWLAQFREDDDLIDRLEEDAANIVPTDRIFEDALDQLKIASGRKSIAGAGDDDGIDVGIGMMSR